LLIGGASSAGKSTVAQRIGQRVGATWVAVDDLRLALQWSRVTLPEGTEALYFFDRTPDVFRLPPERLRDALVGVAGAMSRAVEIVVDNHVHIAEPAVIEGNDILPSLLAGPVIREHADEGRVRAVFVVEPDEAVILGNILARDRRLNRQTRPHPHTQARAYWLYGQWLAAEAGRYTIPVVESRPWETLDERILAACGAAPRG
jgi:2-phosphoglycerate kinase